MSCPYCGSSRTAEEYTVRTFELGNEWVAINHVLCARCGECYSKTVRDNLRTGTRRVTVSRKSYLTDDAPQMSENRRPIRFRLFVRWRR